MKHGIVFAFWEACHGNKNGTLKCERAVFISGSILKRRQIMMAQLSSQIFVYENWNREQLISVKIDFRFEKQQITRWERFSLFPA